MPIRFGFTSGASDRRMPMHHHRAERLGCVEEFMPDPDEIGLVLRVERHAGPDARMDEEIVADGDVQAKRLVEGEMRLGQLGGEDRVPNHGRRLGGEEAGNIDPVGLHGRAAAIHPPMIEHVRIGDEVEQQRLVIAFEKLRVESFGQIVEQHLHDAATNPGRDPHSRRQRRASFWTRAVPRHRPRFGGEGRPINRPCRGCRPRRREARLLAVSGSPAPLSGS